MDVHLPIWVLTHIYFNILKKGKEVNGYGSTFSCLVCYLFWTTSVTLTKYRPNINQQKSLSNFEQFFLIIYLIKFQIQVLIWLKIKLFFSIWGGLEMEKREFEYDLYWTIAG